MFEGELLQVVREVLSHPVTQAGGVGIGSGAIMFALDRFMDILIKWKEFRKK